MKNTFVTAINCIDGRTQEPVTTFLKQKFDVDYVDMITEPGPDKILADNQNVGLIGSIKSRVAISVEKHGSKTIAIVGHYDCAGNPAEKEEHLRQIGEAVGNIKEWGWAGEVYGLWVDENFQVNQLEGNI
jgi:carbonic anhydrase-like protein